MEDKRQGLGSAPGSPNCRKSFGKAWGPSRRSHGLKLAMLCGRRLEHHRFKQRGQAPADGGGGRGCQAPSGVGGLGSRPPPLCFFPEPRVFLRAITRVITPSAKVGLPRTAVGPATKGGLTPTKSHGRVKKRWARWISGVAAGVSSVPCCRCATRFRGLPFIGEAYFHFSSGPLTGDISWSTGRFHPALPPGSASSR